MKNFDLPIYNSKLETKEDLQEVLRQILNPLNKYYINNYTGLHLANTSASYADNIAYIEGLLRLLWGLVPYSYGGGKSDLWNIYVESIKRGTNPECEEFWGQIKDFDQRIVEMAVLGFALALVPDKIWVPLSEKERHNFNKWLLQVNEHKVYECNWLLFRVIINTGLMKVGAEYNAYKIKEDLDKIEEFYIGDGWYSDGKDGYSDYYISFGIHYFSLIYAKIMENEDMDRSILYKKRAAEFAKDFIYWFSEDGSAIPYGRSLTYRFAQSAFWSALVFAGVDVYSLGIVKGLILRNLRWWLKQPIFEADGRLTIGYVYPNLIMAEEYNSPGSPYWSLLSFLILCLKDDHPFWTVSEEPLPLLDLVFPQEKPHFIICRNKENSNILAFNAGYATVNDHTHASAKYEKFVYSTAFGFSIPRGEWGLNQGAFDSTLALCESDDNIYRTKRNCIEYKICDNYVYTRWKPWNNVDVKTWLVCGNPWHIRIHVITTDRILNTAEGGFALGIECDKEIISTDGNSILINSQYGASGIINLNGERKPKIVFPSPNTNIMYSHSSIPMLVGKLNLGRHILASAVYGNIEKTNFENFITNAPVLKIIDKNIIIYDENKNRVFELYIIE